MTCIKGDFYLAHLVRILYLSTDQDMQEDVVEQITKNQNSGKLPFWLQLNEKIHVYWSENHMILWLGSEYLVQQKSCEDAQLGFEKKILLFGRVVKPC
jgi:hypothetical protein